MQGKYIVLDGLDGSGKGTVITAVQESFGKESFVYTKEPGGTPLAEKIRALLLEERMDPYTETCLFLGSRKEVRENVIRPATAKGIHVLSDRSDSSTFAFQIRGRERPHLEDLFWQMNKMIDPKPTLYIFLDLPASVALARLNNRKNEGGEESKFDKEEESFHERVRAGFQEFGRKCHIDHVFVDASQSEDHVAAEVIAVIRKHIQE
jgi:dTMP kinase